MKLAKGETLSHVAHRHGVTVAALQKQNGISDARSVRVGQTLTIPSSASAARATEYRSHKVGRGQTLSDIAALYRISVAALKQHNGIDDPSKLRYGQVLRIPM